MFVKIRGGGPAERKQLQAGLEAIIQPKITQGKRSVAGTLIQANQIFHGFLYGFLMPGCLSSQLRMRDADLDFLFSGKLKQSAAFKRPGCLVFEELRWRN
jgi:hypothetical protein